MSEDDWEIVTNCNPSPRNCPNEVDTAELQATVYETTRARQATVTCDTCLGAYLIISELDMHCTCTS